MVRKRILLLGGGEFHDYEGVCRVMERHLAELPEGFEVERVIGDLDCLRRPRLDGYDVVVLYWTKGRLADGQKLGLLSWCAEGGRFVGVHCAATAFRDCPEYEAMLGGRFRRHPPRRDFFVTVDPSHPAMKHFEGVVPPPAWTNWSVHECLVNDEQFLVQCDRRHLNVAATAAFRGRIWPVAWSKAWGAGKVYYLALGHDATACATEFFKHMLLAGILWVDSPEPEPMDLAEFAVQ